MIKKKKT